MAQYAVLIYERETPGTVARRGALNAMKRRRTLRSKLPLLLEPEGDGIAQPGGDPIPDDRLRLVFTCCHPALSQEAQVALTLRLVCGVATSDIAQAFLVPEATMAARITRAKKKIAAARIPYAVPSGDTLPERVDVVLTVIHLLYATGHTAPSGQELVRDELTGRALDLARMLRLLPAEREVAALRAGPPGRFTPQAAIAALHAQAPGYADTDWPQILTLYDELARVWPSAATRSSRVPGRARARARRRPVARSTATH